MAAQTPEAIAQAFYTTLQNSLSRGTTDVLAYYTDESVLSLDGNNAKGSTQILGQLQQRLSQGPVNIRVTSLDVSPSHATGGLIVLVTGDQTQGSNTAKFQQVYTLMQGGGPGGVRVANDISRLGAGSQALNNAAGQDAAVKYVQEYFAALQNNLSAVTAAYRDTSVMHMEGAAVQGAAAIGEKMASFQGSRFDIRTLDVHLLAPNMPLVLVTGGIVLQGQENPLMFSRVFVFGQDASGLHIANDIFRLNYG